MHTLGTATMIAFGELVSLTPPHKVTDHVFQAHGFSFTALRISRQDQDQLCSSVCSILRALFRSVTLFYVPISRKDVIRNQIPCWNMSVKPQNK
jgi:hypothetical protein